MIDAEKLAEWKRLAEADESGTRRAALIEEIGRLRAEVERARSAGRAVGLSDAAALFDSMHKEGVAWEAASFAAQCRALAASPEIHGYMIWDSLRVVEDRGASETLPPEWDVRDNGGCAVVTSCPTREDAERAKALLEELAGRLRP